MNLIKNLNVTEINTALLSLMDYIKKIENATEKEEQKIESSSSSSSSDFSELTVPLVGGSGKYISAISETDGKINATATDLGNMVPVNSVTSGNMHSVTSNAVASALSGIRFKYADNFVANSAVCNDSNLYNVVLDLGSTRMYFLTGWILVKAGTYTSGTKILDLPAKALINQYVVGYEIGTVTPTVYQFYVENNTSELVISANVTLPAMYIQFNQVIITYAS